MYTQEELKTISCWHISVLLTTRKRNLKALRKPTSTGQKLPDGYTGKWEACSYYFYLETKRVPKKNVWHGDETKIPVEQPPAKVYADKGQKRVPIRCSGQDKENLTAFLVQNTVGDKLPLFPILRGDKISDNLIVKVFGSFISYVHSCVLCINLA